MAADLSGALVEGLAAGLPAAVALVVQALRDAGDEPLAKRVSEVLGASAVDAAADQAERAAVAAFGAPSGRTLPQGSGGGPG